MISADDAAIGDYLDALRVRAGLSVRGLSLAAGYKTGSGVQTQVSNRASYMQPKIAARFAQALYGKGNPPIGLADLAPLVNATLTGPEAITEAALRKLLGLQVDNKPSDATYVGQVGSGRLPVIGSAHASFWMPESPSLDEAAEWLTIPFMSSKPLPGQYALRIVGPSIDKTAQDGSYAICARFGDAPTKLPEGKFVHAVRERRGEIEWTLKKVKWTPDGMLLCPHSTHRDHQHPLRMGDDGDRVSIAGIVIGWFSPA